MEHNEPPDKTLYISEIFYSLQGEGPWVGLPAVFIRLGGCIEPLCPWCDTPYALNGTEELSVADICERVRPHQIKRAVITGGEPFLQWSTGLSDLHKALVDQCYSIQYETSGKVRIPALDHALIVCSPKRIDGAWRFDLSNMNHVHFFKFLAQGLDWAGKIEEFVRMNDISSEKVLVMPLGATRQEQVAGMEDVFGFCLRNGFRMSPRLHTLIFDAKRGV